VDEALGAGGALIALAPATAAHRQGSNQPSPRCEAAGPGPGDAQRLAETLRELRDHMREDAKVLEARASQICGDVIRAALCRGQALAYTTATEHIGAALTSYISAQDGGALGGNVLG